MPPAVSKQEIGSPRYNELLRQEARFWERTSRGEVDASVAPWKRAEIKQVVSDDLLFRTLNVVAARGPRVLDLGCGDAWFARQLAQRGCLVDGVDIAEGRLRRALGEARKQRDAEGWAGDIRLFVADLNRLALARNTYDAVLASAVLHHVVDPESLLDRVFDALKPGGTLVCIDHMEPSPASLMLRYAMLLLLPTEVPYWRKPIHIFNRVMARLYRRAKPAAAAPPAFTLPERSPFEDISGSDVVTAIRSHFMVETYETHLAFADVVAGHLRMGTSQREVRLARRLRSLDDWLIRHRWLRGETYLLIACKPG